MNINITVLSISLLYKPKECEMIEFPCNIDLSGWGGGRFCRKLIYLTNDPDAVCSSSISNS